MIDIVGVALNIADLVEHAVDAAPDNVALIVDDEALTYRELEAASNRIAHHFLARGLGTGKANYPLAQQMVLQA
ncbi:hypothetical protein BH09ACT8_BH09ACT8_17870 [soil metagenome]